MSKKKLKVKTITYSRLISTGEYQNKRISMEIEIQEGQDYKEQMDKLIKTVDQKCEEIVFD